MIRRHRNTRGITLVALVVTIIVLLILAAVSINLVLGENGVITRAKHAKIKDENGKITEAFSMKLAEYEVNGFDDTSINVDNYLKDFFNNPYIAVDGRVMIENILPNSYTGKGNLETGDVYIIEDGDLVYIDKNGNKDILMEVYIQPKFKKISMGREFVLGIDENDELWFWGSNLSSKEGELYGKAKKIIPGVKFKEIAGGEDHCLAVDMDGNLWTWGHNAHGQLGDGTIVDKTEPFILDIGVKVSKVAGAYYFGYVIDENGDIWATGLNEKRSNGRWNNN